MLFHIVNLLKCVVTTCIQIPAILLIIFVILMFNLLTSLLRFSAAF